MVVITVVIEGALFDSLYQLGYYAIVLRAPLSTSAPAETNLRRV